MPGAGGLNLQSVLRHPSDPDQLWVGMSAVGVFHTADGGKTWRPRSDYAPDGQKYSEFEQCVHSLVMAARRPERLYQQNHCGMYRSDNGGQEWEESTDAGLPSTLGFPSAAHPRDPDTLYLCRSTVMCSGGSYRTEKPPSGARAMPVKAGRTCAKGYRKRTLFSVCCSR